MGLTTLGMLLGKVSCIFAWPWHGAPLVKSLMRGAYTRLWLQAGRLRGSPAGLSDSRARSVIPVPPFPFSVARDRFCHCLNFI